MARFNVYGNGHYLCTINQTLRVLQSAFNCERCMAFMQTLIDQHPIGLLIIPSVNTRNLMLFHWLILLPG